MMDAYAGRRERVHRRTVARRLSRRVQAARQAPAHWPPINTLHLLNRMGYTLASPRPSDRTARAAALRRRAPRPTRSFPTTRPSRSRSSQTGLDRAAHDRLHARFPPPSTPGHERRSDARDACLDRVEARARALASPNASTRAREQQLGGGARAQRDGSCAARGRSASRSLAARASGIEAHIVVPGVLDVYGVTIPGAPGMVIGFNRDVAWTFTNTGADVLDYYARAGGRHRDTRRDIRLDGAWRDRTNSASSTIAARGRNVLHGHVRYSHRGPMRHVNGRGCRCGGPCSSRPTSSRRSTTRSTRTTCGGFEDAMARSYFAHQRRTCSSPIAAGTSRFDRPGTFRFGPATEAASTCATARTSASDWTGILAGRGVSAVVRSGAGISRVGESAADRSADRRTGISAPSELRCVARAADQHAAARDSLGDAVTTCAAGRPIRAARAPTCSFRISRSGATTLAASGRSTPIDALGRAAILSRVGPALHDGQRGAVLFERAMRSSSAHVGRARGRAASASRRRRARCWRS